MGTIKALSLFSGIGGLDIAAERVGINIVAMCEINEFCCDILYKRWMPHKNVKIFKDIYDVSLSDIGRVDLIFGGFPCQDLSIAGKKEGLDGDRSGLWYEMYRIIREIRPDYVVIENVRGAINLALDTIKTNMEEEEYQIWSILIPASAFGAPHQRERLFVIGVKRNIVENSRCKLLSWFSQFGEDTGTLTTMANTCSEGLQRGKFNREVDNTGQTTSVSTTECSEITRIMWPTPVASDGGAGAVISPDDTFIQKPSGVIRKVNRHGTDGSCGLARIVKLWPTPREFMWKDSIKDRNKGNIGEKVGEQLNPDWVEQLMGFPEGWTNPDIDSPEEWQGWPALMGENILCGTPNTMDILPSRSFDAMKRVAVSGARKNRSRPGNLREQIDDTMLKAYAEASEENGGTVTKHILSTQYVYEFPRTTTVSKYRKPRLQALGNAVVPIQAYPIFKTITVLDKIIKGEI